jgi:hypothetical protein
MMTFPFTCGTCGHVNHFEWSQAGQKKTCGGCEKSLTVPVPMGIVETVPEPARAFRFKCPSCGRKFSTRSDLAGKKIRCNGCGAGVRVPVGDTVSGTHKSRILTHDSDSQSDLMSLVDDVESTNSSPLIDELSSLESSSRRRRAESVLPSRSETMEKVRQQVAEKEAVDSQKKALRTRNKHKKKKKRSSYFDPKETLKLVAGVSAFVAGIALLAWGYPELRLPLGGFLFVIGFIVYVLGSVSLRQLVAEEGVLKLLFFRFCPPYQWWYVATHWADTRDFVAFFLAGSLIMSLGGGVIKTSPVSKQADASERAFQKMQRGNQAEAPPAVPKRIARDD